MNLYQVLSRFVDPDDPHGPNLNIEIEVFDRSYPRSHFLRFSSVSGFRNEINFIRTDPGSSSARTVQFYWNRGRDTFTSRSICESMRLPRSTLGKPTLYLKVTDPG